MNIKQTIQNLQSLSQQKKNIYYWLSVILFVDVFAGLPHVINFTRTAQCRNYMNLGSLMHSCTTLEFVKNAWAWVSFADICVFVPAAIIMIFASKTLDQLFVKKD